MARKLFPYSIEYKDPRCFQHMKFWCWAVDEGHAREVFNGEGYSFPVIRVQCLEEPGE